MNLLSDRDHLLMVAEMYHCAFKKETKEYKRLHSKWEATYDSLKRTQEAFLEDCIAVKEGMSKMKESYMNLISDREHLLMVAEMYHCAFERETQESRRLHSKWEATYDSVKRTQEALQESRLQIDQIQRDLNVPHPPYCMEKNHVNMIISHARWGVWYIQILLKLINLQP